jgi:hypothetical protein
MEDLDLVVVTLKITFVQRLDVRACTLTFIFATWVNVLNESKNIFN